MSMQVQPPRTDLTPGLIASASALAFMLALSAYAWYALPGDALIPVHWGIDGQPDRYGGRAEALLLAPGIAALLTLVFAVVPRFEPRRGNLDQSRNAYFAIWIGLVTLLAVVHAGLVVTALGRGVNMGVIVATAVGLFFMVVGGAMRTMRSTFFMGIRTPWTLSSELSWNKTHRAGGILFGLLGAAIAAAAWFPNAGAAIVVLVAAALVVGIGLFAYSYFVWRADPDKQSVGRR